MTRTRWQDVSRRRAVVLVWARMSRFKNGAMIDVQDVTHSGIAARPARMHSGSGDLRIGRTSCEPRVAAHDQAL